MGLKRGVGGNDRDHGGHVGVNHARAFGHASYANVLGMWWIFSDFGSGLRGTSCASADHCTSAVCYTSRHQARGHF